MRRHGGHTAAPSRAHHRVRGGPRGIRHERGGIRDARRARDDGRRVHRQPPQGSRFDLKDRPLGYQHGRGDRHHVRQPRPVHRRARPRLPFFVPAQAHARARLAVHEGQPRGRPEDGRAHGALVRQVLREITRQVRHQRPGPEEDRTRHVLPGAVRAR